MPVGWGVVGTGKLATVVVGPIIVQQPENRIVACFDADRGRAEAFAQEHRDAKLYDDYRQLMADPAVEVVYVAAPNAYHAELAIAALRAGKHVLCEKPMAMNMSQGREMVLAARSAGRLLGVGFHLRHKPSNVAVRQAVAEGRIGRLRFGQFDMFAGKGFYPHDTWRIQPELVGGGSAVNQGVHAIDLTRFLTGRNIVKVAATVDHYPLDDIFIGICTLDDGSMVTLTTQELEKGRSDYTLIGELGWVHGVGGTSSHPGDAIQLTDAEGKTAIPSSDQRAYRYEISDFVRAVRGEASLSGDGEDGLHVIAVIDAIYRSVREGRPADVEPIW